MGLDTVCTQLEQIPFICDIYTPKQIYVFNHFYLHNILQYDLRSIFSAECSVQLTAICLILFLPLPDSQQFFFSTALRNASNCLTFITYSYNCPDN